MRNLLLVAMALISATLWSCNADGKITGVEQSSSSTMKLSSSAALVDEQSSSSSFSFNTSEEASSSTAGITSDLALQELYAQGTSYVQVVVNAQVTRILADDTEGDQHQKFIVALGSGQTLLIAHNIDIAPRVPVAVGTRLTIAGEYIWNAEGGLVHWTHHDPDGSHVDGYILLDGVYYK